MTVSRAFEADIVGCRLLFPDKNQRVQHAGVASGVGGLPYHPFMYLHKDTPHVNRVMCVNAVTGAAMLIKRAAWDELNGFDTAFGLGVFEDVDFCWRARAMGKTVIYDGYVFMYHHMHGSKHNHGYHHDVSGQNLKLLADRHQMGVDEHLFYGNVQSMCGRDGKCKF